MIQTRRLIIYHEASDQVLPQINHALADVGLNVIQSFDLQVARATQTGCVCPNHGTDQCDCQMFILQVYDQTSQPATLIAHGHDGHTYVDVVDAPQQRPGAGLVRSIQTALIPAVPGVQVQLPAG